MKKSYKIIILAIIIIFVSIFLIRNIFFQSFVVGGDSMVPTFNSDKQLLINKFSKNFSHGDIVVYEADTSVKVLGAYDGPIRQIYIKRIIALPGEKIEIKNGQVLINGEVVDESYIQGKTMINDDETINYSLTLGNDQYFVMGDNREQSMDSRISGPVEKQDIIGKILGNK
jgi:signal peptidase I